MAIMASSPAPDTSRLDPKPHELTLLDKEKKADANGHQSPLESKLELRSDPQDKAPYDKPGASLVNGKLWSSGDATTNGVATDDVEDAKRKELPTNDSKPTPPPTESSPPKTEEKVAENVEDNKTEESAVKVKSPQPTKSTSLETKSEDAQMTDATNHNITTREPARDEPDLKPSSPQPELEGLITKGPNADIVMTEDKPSGKFAEEPSKPSKIDEPEALPTSEVDLGPESMSQLALEGTSPVEASIEVSMVDAPLSTKVAREREDDFNEEPASKRAKTEPKEEGPFADSVAATPTAGTPAPSGDSGLDRLASLAKWNNAEMDAQKITPYQRREIRKIIGRVKKTKHGAHFRDSVPKLWPQLGESYIARIDKPMDLAEIDRNLRDPNVVYPTFGDMRRDLALIFDNTIIFNGAVHEVTTSAYVAIKAVWQESLLIPEEEPSRPKSVAKPKPPRESRLLLGPEAVQRQSSGPVSSPPPPRDVPEQKPRLPAPSQGADRRRSTATDVDRPKRTVRAPKPKDIDYTTKPSRKKLKPELQFCDEVLAELMHPKHQAHNTWFLDAVDAEGLNIPEYYSIIKKPMDLGKVSRMMNGGEITSLKDFDRNVRLIFTNCYQFNGPVDQGNPVSLVARQLEELYSQQMKSKDTWLAKYAKANAPASASDDDDEDESDDDDGSSVPSVDIYREIQVLQAKLDEESKKLNGMFASGVNSGLIDCQKSIVEAVQRALYTTAQNQGGSKSKSDKPSKKSSKLSKHKPSSSGPSGKSTGNAPPPPKKSGSIKKSAPKKSLSAADKDQIASAINDLEYPHLDRAIDIIKRDTGQNENNDGELELDIDQLSNEALLKLWELCRKVLPGFGKDSAAAATKLPQVNRAIPAKQASTTKQQAAKPRKNKPMSAQEQEARIAQLTAISQLYRPGQEPGDEATTHVPSPNQQDESSDDSDSEEE